MGQEMQCQVEFNGKRHSGKALLETHEIVFRGDLRLKIPRKAISEVRAEEGRLVVVFDEGTAAFDLGKAAPKWAEKILHPPTRLDKFGIKSGTRFSRIGEIDPEFLAEVREAGAMEDKDADLVLLAASDKRALSKLKSTGSKTVWIIYPKGIPSITEGNVLKAGRDAGLVDIKVVGFSGTHTALKFMPPRKKP
jgi:hypothetical protein